MIAKRALRLTKAVNVGFSCGKDSLATLDICCRTFPKVRAFFMWLVPGLSFQANYLRFIEQRFGLRVISLPHWQIGSMLRATSFRPGSRKSMSCPLLSIADIEREVSARTGCGWFAYGMTRFDSLERNAMLKQCAGIDLKTRRMFPIMNMTRTAIFSYLKLRKIPLPVDYKMFGRSFGRLWPQELLAIKTRFPKDYDTIQKHFPHVEAQIKRAQLEPVPEV